MGSLQHLLWEQAQRPGLLFFFINFNMTSYKISSHKEPRPLVYWVRQNPPLWSTQPSITMGPRNQLERLFPWARSHRRAASYLVWIWCWPPLESWVVWTVLSYCTACNLTLQFKWLHSFCAARWETQTEALEGLGKTKSNKNLLPNEILFVLYFTVMQLLWLWWLGHHCKGL
jgi:hypothetical protein